MSEPITLATAIYVRDTCLCLAAQRATRLLARRFDQAFAGLGITNNQYSLMMMLSAPQPPLMSRLAPALGMDRTTLTAAFKALERRGLAVVEADAKDRRGRRARLTDLGRETLAAGTVIWRAEHAALEAQLPHVDKPLLRSMLGAIADLSNSGGNHD